jgi:hypothetical protein
VYRQRTLSIDAGPLQRTSVISSSVPVCEICFRIHQVELVLSQAVGSSDAAAQIRVSLAQLEASCE